MLDLLSPLGAVRARRMFGGHGLYLDDVMFGLIADGMLYLKVDDDSRPDFEDAGAAPFVYASRGGAVTMSYYAAPDAAMEEPEQLVAWGRLAVDAALRARRRG